MREHWRGPIARTETGRAVLTLDTSGAESVRYWARSVAGATVTVRCAPLNAPELEVTVATLSLSAGVTQTGTMTGPAGIVRLEYTGPGGNGTDTVSVALQAK